MKKKDDICTQVQQACTVYLAHNSLSEKGIEKAKAYARKALSENTLKSYQSDLECFIKWGGQIPAAPEEVASYIAEFAGELAVSTLSRRIASINKAHEMSGYSSPTKSEIVRMTMRGIRRQHSSRQKQASPLLRDDLIQILNHMSDDPKSIRDTAALMVGFSCALRRSELVALNIEDIEFVDEGAIITIQKSKTDQEGHGRKIAIPKGRSRYCPIQSLKLWLERLNEPEGAVFRSIRKGGHIQQGRLSSSSVSCLVKEYAQKIDLDPSKYSGHSLRAGFITSAAMLGIPEWQIMKQSGHKSHATMMRYVRDARLFDDHPLEAMF